MQTSSIRRALTLPLATLLGLTAFANARAATQPIDIRKFAFVPKEITVAPGTTIVWTNHDDTPHMVVARDHGFASKGMDTDDRYEFTFTRAGDFSYFCTMHPFMTGIVHVRK